MRWPISAADAAASRRTAAPAAVIVADGIGATPELVDAANRNQTPLFTSPLPAARVIEKLARYLGKALADSVERHGVFMDVLGLGVMIIGESGVGKSELALELVSRGHGLVADDVVEISRIAADTLEGRCPPLLKDFLEVRGLGLLNIRTIFGETAVRPKMKLKLIAQLVKPPSGARDTTERLPLSELSEEILGGEQRRLVGAEHLNAVRMSEIEVADQRRRCGRFAAHRGACFAPGDPDERERLAVVVMQLRDVDLQHRAAKRRSTGAGCSRRAPRRAPGAAPRR